jgi:hypothetical protein
VESKKIKLASCCGRKAEPPHLAEASRPQPLAPPAEAALEQPAQPHRAGHLPADGKL